MENGAAFERGNARSLAGVLDSIFADPSRLADMRLRSRRLAEEIFDWKVVAARTLRIYEDALQGANSLPAILGSFDAKARGRDRNFNRGRGARMSGDRSSRHKLVVRTRFDRIAATYEDTIVARRRTFNDSVDRIVSEHIRSATRPLSVLDAACGTGSRWTPDEGRFPRYRAPRVRRQSANGRNRQIPGGEWIQRSRGLRPDRHFISQRVLRPGHLPLLPLFLPDLRRPIDGRQRRSWAGYCGPTACCSWMRSIVGIWEKAKSFSGVGPRRFGNISARWSILISTPETNHTPPTWTEVPGRVHARVLQRFLQTLVHGCRIGRRAGSMSSATIRGRFTLRHPREHTPGLSPHGLTPAPPQASIHGKRGLSVMSFVPLVDLKTQYATIEAEVRAAMDEVLDSAQFINGPGGRRFRAEVCGPPAEPGSRSASATGPMPSPWRSKLLASAPAMK